MSKDCTSNLCCEHRAMRAFVSVNHDAKRYQCNQLANELRHMLSDNVLKHVAERLA